MRRISQRLLPDSDTGEPSLAVEGAMSRMHWSTFFGSAAVVGFAVLSATIPVAAACYEDVGCTNDHVMPYPALQGLSCEQLWTVRNAIFQENGFCFRTKRALAVFSNDGCTSYVSG